MFCYALRGVNGFRSKRSYRASALAWLPDSVQNRDMLLKGKRALIFGVVNERSIAYGIAEQFHKHGARLGFGYASDPVRKRLEPISEHLGGEFLIPCDVTSDAQIQSGVDVVREKWGGVDVLVHSIAYANREDLKGRFIDTSREGYRIALDVSSYSLVALCRAYESLLKRDASVITLSYYGAGRVVANYNAMGVAKAALEACVRYLAVDLGSSGVRINAGIPMLMTFPLNCLPPTARRSDRPLAPPTNP
jgi:enoyl-[acyl-carrier protein] reductase I